jgi:dihydroorotate dehydrogenase electron transfer subunit
MTMILLKDIPLISNRRLKEDIFQLKLYSPEIVKFAQPGNFVHIRVSPTNTPLLGRAFSIYSIDSKIKTFDLLFKVVGPGTLILSQKKFKDRIDILGPLGNNFSYPKPKEKVILAAGGMGIAPLFFLVSFLIRNKKLDPKKIDFLYGEKSEKGFVCLDDLKELRVNLFLATENGSFGFKGLVTELFLRKKKDSFKNRDTIIYSCGPQKMMEKMAEISKRYDLCCQLSLESHMPCGIGACMGCVVKYGDKAYKRICSDGPVFDAQEVRFDRFTG